MLEDESVAQLQRLLQPIVGDTVELHCNLEPDCRVLVEVGQVEQVLVHLVSNAKDAMPMGGSCAISVHRATDADGRPAVRLAVTDEGVGMDAASASPPCTASSC